MIIDVGRPRAERFAKRTISPSFDNMRLRCGKCGGMDFEVHVGKATYADVAFVSELVCLGCLTVRKVNAMGQVEGKNTANNIRDDYISPKPNDIRAEDIKNGRLDK